MAFRDPAEIGSSMAGWKGRVSCEDHTTLEDFQHAYSEWEESGSPHEQTPLSLLDVTYEIVGNEFETVSNFYQQQCHASSVAAWFHQRAVRLNPMLGLTQAFEAMKADPARNGEFLDLLRDFVRQGTDYREATLAIFLFRHKAWLSLPNHWDVAQKIYRMIEDGQGSPKEKVDFWVTLALNYFEADALEDTRRALDRAIALADEKGTAYYQSWKNVLQSVSHPRPEEIPPDIQRQVPEALRPTILRYRFEKEGQPFELFFYGDRSLSYMTEYFQQLERLPTSLLRSLLQHQPPFFVIFQKDLAARMRDDGAMMIVRQGHSSHLHVDPQLTWVRLTFEQAFSKVYQTESKIDRSAFPARTLYHELTHWFMFHALTGEDWDLLEVHVAEKRGRAFASREEFLDFLRALRERDEATYDAFQPALGRVFATPYGQKDEYEDSAEVGSLVASEKVYAYQSPFARTDERLYRFFARVWKEEAWNPQDFQRVFREEFSAIRNTPFYQNYNRGLALTSTVSVGAASDQTAVLDYRLSITGLNGDTNFVPRVGPSLLLKQPWKQETPKAFLGGFLDWQYAAANAQISRSGFRGDLSAGYCFGGGYFTYPHETGVCLKAFGGAEISHRFEDPHFFAGAAIGVWIPHLMTGSAIDALDWDAAFRRAYGDE